MPTTCSTAFPARATITSPVKAGEICSTVIAGVKADTNQSETNAEPTPAPTKTTTANQNGQEGGEAASPFCTIVGPPCSETGMLAIKTIRRITAEAILSTSSCPAAGVCNREVSVGTISAATDNKVRFAIMRGVPEEKC